MNVISHADGINYSDAKTKIYIPAPKTSSEEDTGTIAKT